MLLYTEIISRNIVHDYRPWSDCNLVLLVTDLISSVPGTFNSNWLPLFCFCCHRECYCYEKPWFCNLFAIFWPAQCITFVSAMLLVISPLFQNYLLLADVPKFCSCFCNFIIVKHISYILHYISQILLLLATNVYQINFSVYLHFTLNLV